MTATTEHGFRGDYFFLSNFYPSPIEIDYRGESFIFPTGEHVFQAKKVQAALYPDSNVAALRRLAAEPSPSKAKYWGRSIRIDLAAWDLIAVDCMRRTLLAKFTQNPELLDKLVATGDTELIEFNSWNDTKWGVNETTREGENMLGRLLMELRESA
jgi:ribA/ribD-fused uncharacterized protein